ncbi:hypothetical protein BCR32DRAFT_247029 [Anaeromyces robustus]|uniref:EGF-like domain-containing protein n=1 Tax=Anaeromyces robustus TaxID=1754192 RepID=A0A1Y1WYN5_9FUNG|nr:hypothetical protein BCR32DRAFT_247029 [Anaeromyces robustus]|eukprot:ORX78613.1 hypothetical protein BCR32DRAFT_247029 [Anaeromyces robustus]
MNYNTYIIITLIISFIRNIYCQNNNYIIYDNNDKNKFNILKDVIKKGVKPEFCNSNKISYCYDEDNNYFTCLLNTTDHFYQALNYINKDTNEQNQNINNESNSGLIMEACNKEYNEQICITRSCQNDENCFSGICDMGTCITNIDRPLLICQCDEKYNMTCSRAEQEHCTNNNDCITSYCEGKTNLCLRLNNDNRKNSKLLKL